MKKGYENILTNVISSKKVSVVFDGRRNQRQERTYLAGFKLRPIIIATIFTSFVKLRYPVWRPPKNTSVCDSIESAIWLPHRVVIFALHQCDQKKIAKCL